jgi:putative membrane protein
VTDLASSSARQAPQPPEADPGWRRLHPRMLLVHPVQEVLRAFPALLGALVAGSRSGNGDRWTLLVLATAVALGIAKWFTTTYRIGSEQVQVRRGLFTRRVTSVPRDRLRTVDVTSHPLHRLLGLARVEVGTGLSDRKEQRGLRLDALGAREAARLRGELLSRSGTGHCGAGQSLAGRFAAADAPAAPTRPETDPEMHPETELARLRPGWVRFAPFTLSGLVTIGVLAGFVSQRLNEAQLDPARFGPLQVLAGRLGEQPLWMVLAGAAAGLVVLAIVASVGGYVLAFWGFRLTRQAGGTLHVSRGLVTTRETTLEERRLRGVEVSEPLLLRLVRGGRCLAIATGLQVGRGTERGGSLLLPPAPLAEARRVAAAVLGRAAPIDAPLVRHGRRAARRRYTRALAAAAVLVAAAAAGWRWLGLFGWLPVLALAGLPVAWALAADRYRNLGHALVDRTLVTAWGSLVRRRCALRTDGIIGWNLRQSFFQRRAGLATLTATTAAGEQHYPVADLPAGTAVRLADEALPGLLTPFLQ